MKTLVIIIRKEVQTKEEAQTAKDQIQNKLTDQPNITIEANYKDEEKLS